MSKIKVRLNFNIKMNGMSSRKQELIEVDYKIISKLRGSSTRDKTVQDLIGHKYPGGIVSGSSFDEIRD